MELSIELGRGKLKLRDLLKLEYHSVFALDTNAGGKLNLYINGILLAKGEPVVVDNQMGIRIDEIPNLKTKTFAKGRAALLVLVCAQGQIESVTAGILQQAVETDSVSQALDTPIIPAATQKVVAAKSPWALDTPIVAAAATQNTVAAKSVSQALPTPIVDADSLSQAVEPDTPLFGAGESAVPISEDALSNAQVGMVSSGVRTVGSMVFILGLILGAAVLLKRYMPHRFGPLGHKRRIQVLETIPIGEKRSLTLIEIDGATLLLASTPGSVSLLKEIRPACDLNSVTTTETRPDASKDARPVQLFSDALAAEVHPSPPGAHSTPLVRLSRLRQSLEAR